MRPDRAATLLDYLILPGLLLSAIAATYLLLQTSLSPSMVTTIVFPPVVAVVILLERLYPESVENLKLDQPLSYDLGHFLLGTQPATVIGYGAAFAAAAAIASILAGHLDLSIWPKRLPLALQILLAFVIGESFSYWQHRLIHKIDWCWRFHALHHSGKRMNVVRAGRFHLLDNATASFTLFIPLALLGAPAEIFTWAAVLAGMMGLTQHANIRMRTPKWLDRIICTPAVHRFHHSSEFREADGNFGTSVMFFDLLFGSYKPPTGPAPQEFGIKNDPVPRSFWQQFLGRTIKESAKGQADNHHDSGLSQLN